MEQFEFREPVPRPTATAIAGVAAAAFGKANPGKWFVFRPYNSHSRAAQIKKTLLVQLGDGFELVVDNTGSGQFELLCCYTPPVETPCPPS